MKRDWLREYHFHIHLGMMCLIFSRVSEFWLTEILAMTAAGVFFTLALFDWLECRK